MITGTIALAAGFVLDLILGDPSWIYHPVCLIGKLIAFLEGRLRHLFPKTKKGELAAGGALVILTCLISYLIPFCLLLLLYRIFPVAGVLLETVWCWQLFAGKSLAQEAMKVYKKVKKGTLEEARRAVSMIVGRDTDGLTFEGVIKATVETVAENASDGVLAPMFYMAVGGAPLMFLYKAVNTMDSMVGYKNEKHLYFGRCAAKTDDVANFIPSRICGLLMCLAAFLCGLDCKNSFRIYLRDRGCHASPNSAQTEAAMAGALGVQLAGDAFYFGKLYKKPAIGDSLRPIEPEDIPRSAKVLFAVSWLGVVLFLGLRLAVGFLV